jgi:LmbE family N-acetylglucosaminyl deacetylase
MPTMVLLASSNQLLYADRMRSDLTALERAFELARSGKCLGVHDIVLHLHSEGYSVAQIEGPQLKKQLLDLINEATNPPRKGTRRQQTH